MVKKVVSYIALAISIFAVAVFIRLACDTVMEYDRISHSPGSSGVDYLGFAIVPALSAIISVTGGISSFVCFKTAAIKAVRIIMLVLFVMFTLIFILSCMAYIKPLLVIILLALY